MLRSTANHWTPTTLDLGVDFRTEPQEALRGTWALGRATCVQSVDAVIRHAPRACAKRKNQQRVSVEFLVRGPDSLRQDIEATAEDGSIVSKWLALAIESIAMIPIDGSRESCSNIKKHARGSGLRCRCVSDKTCRILEDSQRHFSSILSFIGADTLGLCEACQVAFDPTEVFSQENCDRVY